MEKWIYLCCRAQ